MNEILIFTTGASFGALVVCFSVCAAIFASSVGRDTSSASRSSAPSHQGEGFSAENEQMKKQFANFLNYDGTVDSQVELGGE